MSSTNLIILGGFDDEPTFDCASVPLAVRTLAHTMADKSLKLRTAVLWLSPEAYAAGAHWATCCLGLLPRHLGREVTATCTSRGTQRVPATAADLLQHVYATHTTNHMGTWLWGLDALLTRLSSSERQVFWQALYGLRQQPPLLLALPQAFQEFGPANPDQWLKADPSRGLHL